MGQYVGLQVVDLNQRNLQCLCKAFGKRHAYQQRAEQSGAAREGHGVDVAAFYAGVVERSVHYGHYILLVGTRCQLGHHATVLFVHLLRGDDVRQQTVVAQNGRRSVVARGFYGKYVWHILSAL